MGLCARGQCQSRPEEGSLTVFLTAEPSLPDILNGRISLLNISVLKRDVGLRVL